MHERDVEARAAQSTAMAFEPASGGQIRGRRSPHRGPDSSVLTGCSAAPRAAVIPPFDCMMWTLAATPAAELLVELAEVAPHGRRDGGVDDRGAGALVLAPLVGDPVRERDADRPGWRSSDDLLALQLVGGVAIAVQRRPPPPT